MVASERATAVPRSSTPLLSSVDVAIAVVAILLSGAGSLWLGQDLNFDLLSYHYYNGYAFVKGRLDRDIAPAGWQTYLSPTMDALSYLGMSALPPRVFGFVFGALHGLNTAFVYLLGLALLSPMAPWRLRVLATLTAIVSAFGPNAVSLLGTTMGNNLVSLPLLAALLVLVWPPAGEAAPRAPLAWSNARLVLAATLCGIASGLRLTAAADHIALCLVVLGFTVWRRSPRAQLAACVALGVFSLVGFLMVNGIWSARLIERFGNPIFPLANQVFQSPYFAPEFMRDARWVARDALDFLRPPLDLALGRTQRLQEIGARDARYFALAACGVALAIRTLLRWRTRRPVPLSSPMAFATAFWIASYVLWASVFHYYRYMTTLEFVAPLILVGLLRSLAPAKALMTAVLGVSVVILAGSRTDSWGRGDWQDNWFGLELPALARKSDAMVLLAGAPVTFALPAFPGGARFVHLDAIRAHGGTELFDQRIVASLREHHGPLLLLANFRVDKDAQNPAKRRPRWRYNPEEDAGPVAARFGLRLTDRCEDMRTRRGPLYLCEVERGGR